MSEKTRSSRPKRRTFPVGGRVYVHFGNRRRIAHIVEDRGTIGRGGRRLLRVAFGNEAGDAEHSFEIPAEDVTDVPTIRRSPRTGKSKPAHA